MTVQFYLVRSLARNDLKAEGAKHVADMLMINKTLTSVKYAASLLVLTVSTH